MFRRQRTIGQEVTCTGRGLHTGSETQVRFKPAPVDTGVRFIRSDLPGRPEIPSNIEHVIGVFRGTDIGINGVEVRTSEHVLAALAGLQIDNVSVELSSNEPPVGDGSARIFVEALFQAGFVEQEREQECMVIEEPIRYVDPDDEIELVALPSEQFKITFMSHAHKSVDAQYTVMSSLDEFVDEYAPARTCSFLSEVRMLREKGLIKGGSLENAVIIVDEVVDQEEINRLRKLFRVDRPVTIGENGLLEGTELRFENEFARHKTLDLIGDLSLLGVPIQGHVLATNSGHAANVELVRRIKEAYEKKRLAGPYQPTKGDGFLLDINAIQKIMPHRYPFLLVDRILDLTPRKRVIGLKNVTINEPFFTGHFPGLPIMPAVLQLEAMAQVGGILFLSTVEDPEGKIVLFASIHKAKFRKPVVPGDQLIFELTMLRLRKSTCRMQGKAYVNGNVVTEAQLTAMVVDRESIP